MHLGKRICVRMWIDRCDNITLEDRSGRNRHCHMHIARTVVTCERVKINVDARSTLGSPTAAYLY
jgi:hypothetical protein